MHLPPLYRSCADLTGMKPTTEINNEEAVVLGDGVKLVRLALRSRSFDSVGTSSGEPNDLAHKPNNVKQEGNAFQQQSSREGVALSSQARVSREKDKKSMLAQALLRANDAVAMDNDQDYGSAVIAYEGACDFLSRVMSKTSNEEDRRKLRAIV